MLRSSTQRAVALASWMGLAACGDDGGEPRGSADARAPRGPLDGGTGALDSSTSPSKPPGNDPPRNVPQGDGAVRQCNHAEIAFESRLPTAYLLVDRSSSMFDEGRWEPLKVGVLAVVEQLDADVRFGFGTYTGQNGGTCPDMSTVPIALNNFQAIQAAYGALGETTYKGETPTAQGIAAAARTLAADPEPGAKYILLVTDGEPDFCDDGNVTCARDAVVAAAQDAFKQDVRTFIFSIGGEVSRSHLRDVANAGSGLGVIDHGASVKNQCQGGVASYAASEGDAPYYEPNVSDQGALVTALRGVVAQTRSCVFDLTGKVKIDLERASLGEVKLDGQALPFGADGFRMNTPTELELLGTACEQLHRPIAPTVSIDFPCEAVIVI